MDGAVHPASIAIVISIGISVLMGSFSVLIATRSGEGAAVRGDTTVSIFFGIAFLLTCLDLIAAALIAVWGMAYAGPLKATLLLTAAFAAAGMVCGLVRSLRGGAARKTQKDWGSSACPPKPPVFS